MTKKHINNPACIRVQTTSQRPDKKQNNVCRQQQYRKILAHTTVPSKTSVFCHCMNPCHAKYFYVQLSSPIFILLVPVELKSY